MTLPSDIQGEAPDRNRLLLIPKLVLIGAAVFAAGEASWRLTGFRPAHSDLLAFDRVYKAARDSSNAVALIGSSRVLCDLDPKILKRELPKWDFYQLAVDGSSALLMLENLARDATFRGHVLCEFSMADFMGEYPFRGNDLHQQQYVQIVRRRPFLDFLQTWFFETLSQHSALVAAKDWDFIGVLRTRLPALVRNRAEASSALFPEGAPGKIASLGLTVGARTTRALSHGGLRWKGVEERAPTVYSALHPGWIRFAGGTGMLSSSGCLFQGRSSAWKTRCIQIETGSSKRWPGGASTSLNLRKSLP